MTAKDKTTGLLINAPVEVPSPDHNNIIIHLHAILTAKSIYFIFHSQYNKSALVPVYSVFITRNVKCEPASLFIIIIIIIFKTPNS